MTEEPIDATLAWQPRPVWAWLAWLAILALIGFAVLVGRPSPPAEVPAEIPADEKLQLLAFEFQARLFVGLANTPQEKPLDLSKQLAGYNTGTVAQRLRYVILAGEVLGPHDARTTLDDLLFLMTFAPDRVSDLQWTLSEILERVYSDYTQGNWDAPSLPAEERELLKAKLGWFGELALAPKQTAAEDAGAAAARQSVLEPATQSIEVVLSALLSGLALVLAGFAMLMVLVNLARRGKLQSGLDPIAHGGVYAETFLVWFALFQGLSILALFAADWPGPLRNVIAMAGSLFAVVWPRLRGLSFQQIRQDIGWTLGRKPALEPVVGVAGYAMALPLALIGITCSGLLLLGLRAFEQQSGGGQSLQVGNTPVHPIIYGLSHGDFWTRLEIFLLACIAAPIVEETFFRGVLYRNLREATRSWGWMSFFASAFVSSFLFAIVHPQGAIAVPALAALGFSFCILREWRGTLIPSMIAHGINNGLVLWVVVTAFGG